MFVRGRRPCHSDTGERVAEAGHADPVGAVQTLCNPFRVEVFAEFPFPGFHPGLRCRTPAGSLGRTRAAGDPERVR